jgi:hypothetical protein
MKQGEDDRQEERPVRSQYAGPCDRCSRSHGHDGYALPTTTVYDNEGSLRMVLCAQCLRDALANLQTEQQRMARSTSQKYLPRVSSALPQSLQRTKPWGGVGQRRRASRVRVPGQGKAACWMARVRLHRRWREAGHLYVRREG